MERGKKWVEYNRLPDRGLEKRYIKMNKYSSCLQGVFNLVDLKKKSFFKISGFLLQLILLNENITRAVD